MLQRLRPSVSLCMIVRDEAEMLPRFLRRARGVWDELCVVDTGSTDATVDLLRGAGAKIIHREWDDDFAAARNAGLERATGDWILFLDADEMVAPDMQRHVRETASNPSAGAATVRMRNELPHGHYTEARLLRMFRNAPSIRFRYRIHEDVNESVVRYLGRTDRHIVHLPAVVTHLGYVRDVAAARDKKNRDLALLRRCLADDPDDLYSWFKILELARFWRDQPLWRTLAAEGVVALERCRSSARLDDAHHVLGELVVLVAQGLCAGEPGAALRFLEPWERRVPDNAPFFLFRAELREQVGHPGAELDFRRCLAMTETTRNRQLATTRPRLGLARLAMATGDFAGAGQWASSALAENPLDLEALLSSVFLARRDGGAVGVETFVLGYLEDHGDSPELRQALGEEALLCGDGASAVREFEKAAGRPPSGQAALRLAHAHMVAGDLDAVRRIANVAKREVPALALGVLVCDLIAGAESDLEIELDKAECDRAMRAWVEMLLRSGRIDLLEGFCQHAPMVSGVFPWLIGTLAERVGSALDEAGAPAAF